MVNLLLSVSPQFTDGLFQLWRQHWWRWPPIYLELPDRCRSWWLRPRWTEDGLPAPETVNHKPGLYGRRVLSIERGSSVCSYHWPFPLHSSGLSCRGRQLLEPQRQRLCWEHGVLKQWTRFQAFLLEGLEVLLQVVDRLLNRTETTGLLPVLLDSHWHTPEHPEPGDETDV